MKLKLDNFILRLESKANIQNHKINQQKSLKVLTIEQLKEYETMGFLAIESFVENEWLSSLKEITYKMIEESRKVKETNNKFVVECNHSSESPRRSQTIPLNIKSY